jgi:hypothetical protein
MSADGTNKRRLTRWKGADAANACLPDGRIVVAHLDGDEPLPRWYLIRPTERTSDRFRGSEARSTRSTGGRHSQKLSSHAPLGGAGSRGSAARGRADAF